MFDQNYCFYGIFDDIHVVVLSIRLLSEILKKILPTPNFWTEACIRATKLYYKWHI